MKNVQNIQTLEEFMCKPSAGLIKNIKSIKGDIMVLGAGGKMGPTLCKLAYNAIRQAKTNSKVIAVSRFSEGDLYDDLKKHGITVIKADLLDNKALTELPSVENIIFMAGRKFGTADDQSLTWALNTYLPGRVADRFKDSRIVAFSTGNVYPLIDIHSGGCTESSPTGPIGVYANSCLGRENIFTYFSKKNDTPMLLFRLNYAIDMRYGVLLEIARTVYQEEAVDLSMGYFNAIWQGYANEAAIRSLLHCKVPPSILNVTGSETISVRETAIRFAKLFNKQADFKGTENETALLSDASKCMDLYGEPSVKLDDMIEKIAQWIIDGQPTINKPTHFQEREGKY